MRSLCLTEDVNFSNQLSLPNHQLIKADEEEDRRSVEPITQEKKQSEKTRSHFVCIKTQTKNILIPSASCIVNNQKKKKIYSKTSNNENKFINSPKLVILLHKPPSHPPNSIFHLVRSSRSVVPVSSRHKCIRG